MCIIKSYQKTVETIDFKNISNIVDLEYLIYILDKNIDVEEFYKENKDDNDYGR